MTKSIKAPRCKRFSGKEQIVRRAEDLPETTLEDLVGCADYKGPVLSLEEMNAAIAEGASHYSRSSSDSPVRRSSGS